MHFKNPRSAAPNMAGRIPRTGCTCPFKPISPTTRMSAVFSFGMISSAAISATVIGRSKADPDFRTPAGERFTVIRFAGSRYPAFRSAVRTRSLASLASAPRKPTKIRHPVTHVCLNLHRDTVDPMYDRCRYNTVQSTPPF